MPLSQQEQRALERIAVDLSAADPWLAATLAHDGWTAIRWRRRAAAAVMFIVGMAMLSSAVFVPRSVPGGVFTVAILGYLVMFDASLRWFGRHPRRRRRTRFRQTD